MTVIRDLGSLNQQFPNPILTIGNFDGVHLGHKALFDLVRERAAALEGTSMVLTFEPHPLRVLTGRKDPPLITLYDQRIELIQAAGIEVVVCLEFTLALAKIEPEDFVLEFLVGRIGVKELVIGYDYTFGHRARGNRDLLLRLGAAHGFQVHTVSAQPGQDGQIISSTRIRELVESGQVDKAPTLLGRYYRLAGRVIRGRDRGGRLLGFPTANLRLVDELIPKIGVYAVKVHHRGRTLDGVANIGHNPTFGDVGLSVEVHCFNFSENIYDQDIKVDFIARVRDERKFSGPEELAAQIARDCDWARKILADRP
ncbi:MAG: bifunctional riboflavin kinase/FAD synthetase [Thermodesulfobacteriota bacterium]